MHFWLPPCCHKLQAPGLSAGKGDVPSPRLVNIRGLHDDEISIQLHAFQGMLWRQATSTLGAATRRRTTTMAPSGSSASAAECLLQRAA